MESLIELLLIVPEIIAELVLDIVFGKRSKFKDEQEKPREENGGLDAIVVRMGRMQPEQKKKVKLFNIITVLIVGAVAIAVAIATEKLMETYSGWLFLPGIAVQIIFTVIAYQWWKRKALRMTERV